MSWATHVWNLLRPDVYLRSVVEIRPEWLKARGKRALLVDLDNTLTGWRSREVDGAIAAWVAVLKAAGIGMCIISNSRFPRRVRQVGERLDVPVVAWAGKPGKAGYRRALSRLDCPPSEAAGVGDQLFTDVLGANRMGLLSVLVERLTPSEFIGNRLVRILERRVMRKIGVRVSEFGIRDGLRDSDVGSGDPPRIPNSQLRIPERASEGADER